MKARILAAIGIGIIGYGYMGEIRRRVTEVNPALRLVGIVDTKSRPVDLPHTCEWIREYRDIVEHQDVDAVFVCLPNVLIPEVAEFALQRGKHVFCEKPPGRSVADIKRIIRAEVESKGKVVFGFNHRFHPAMLEALEIIRSGKLGKLLWGRGLYGKAGGDNFMKSWRVDTSVSGGGILLDQGIHMLDLFRLYFGDFQRVKAFTGSHYWDIDSEDNAFVILENDAGQHATLHSSATLWKHTFNLEMGLTDGYLSIEGFLSKSGSYGRETLTIGHREFEQDTRAMGNPREEKRYYDKDLSWALEVDHFVAAIVEDRPVDQCSTHDALRVMELIEAAYDSAKA